MYLKLSVRNAKRSLADYLLYIITMALLLAVMEVSNYLSAAAKQEAGFQTASLPTLILTIMVILVCYMDAFMMKTRAGEFAAYLLMGMEKQKLSWMFLLELFAIGLICLGTGGAAGAGAGILFSFTVSGYTGEVELSCVGRSLLHTCYYFCLMEGLSAFFIKRRMDRLEIRELMQEKERSQYVSCRNTTTWGGVFVVSFLVFSGMLLGIVFLPETMALPLFSVIAVPVLICIGAFYSWLFGFLCGRRERIRVNGDCFLYKGSRLYMLAQITSKAGANVWISNIFSVCLLFSTASFLTGFLMLQPEFPFFDEKNRQWMGLVQISLCAVFTVIYFCVLSFQEMKEQQEEEKGILILHYLGKSRGQIYGLIRARIAARMLLPVSICIFLALPGIPLLNRKLNSILPAGLKHILLKGTGEFVLYFLFLYGCYFYAAYRMSRRRHGQ